MRELVLIPLLLALSASSASGQAAPVAANRVQRFLDSYDLNRDGRVTHDELNRALAMQFQAHARHGALSLDGFVALRDASYRQLLAQRFRTLDWNGDGRLSFDEYATPIRARFETFAGTGGAESCKTSARQVSFVKARFCRENDLDNDGKVTRAELDRVSAKRFAAMTGKAKGIDEAQYVADALTQGDGRNAAYFRKLDRDRDGKLSLAEFAAPQEALFKRLDRNRDGTLSRDELAAPRVYARTSRAEPGG